MGKDYQDVDWDNWEYDPNDDGAGDYYRDEEKIIVKDANGNILEAGDSVVAIKDLQVKGAKDIKRGDKFTKIRLTDDPNLIESGSMVLKTEFFKKV